MLHWLPFSGKEVLVFIGGNAFLLGLYFLKRWWQRDGDRDRLDLDAKTLALHESLRRAGMSVDQLRGIRDEFKRRRGRVQKREENITYEIALDAIQGPRPGETQAEMNMIASADLEIARAKLDRAVLELSMHQDELGQKSLDEAQRAWERYSEAEAALRAQFCEGGTMYPAVYRTELEGHGIPKVTLTGILGAQEEATVIHAIESASAKHPH